MSAKGRMMGLCWECERSVCICGYASDDSISLCSEDELRGEEEPQAVDLSFISEAPCDNEKTCAAIGPDEKSSPALTSHPKQLGAAQGHKAEVNAPLPDKGVFVSDFTAYDPSSSTPDLAVFTVSANQDIIVEPQCTVSAETDVVIHGNNPQGANKAMFNFCPLVQNSPASVHGTRLASIAGGGVFVGHTGRKRLKVSVSNPGGFCKIFIPKKTSLGVLEIYTHRY